MRMLAVLTVSLTSAGLLGACSSNDGLAELRCEVATTGDPELNTEFNLRIGSTAVINGADQSLQLEFVAVDSDSRCPSDVTCVQAGSAVISMIGTVEGGEPRAFTLDTDADNREFFETQNGPFGGRYTVELRSVLPVPLSDRPIPADGYCASFIVTQVVQ